MVKVKKENFKPIKGSPTLQQIQESVKNKEEPLKPTLPVINPPATPEKDTTPKVYRDPRTGNLSGVEINGKTFFGLSPDEVNQIIEKENNRNATPKGAVEMGTFAKQQEANEQISQIGQLTPEQQQTALGSTEINMPLDENIRKIALQKTGIGALTSIGGGLGTAAIGAGIGAGAATGGLAIGAAGAYAALGGVKDVVNAFTGGTFEMYKHQAEEKTGFVNKNVQAAQQNIRRAIMLANKGGDAATAVNEFNKAYSELILAERQLKVLSKDTYEYTTNAREDWQELNNYMQGLLPMQQQQLAIAIQKPDPSYVDYEVMSQNQNE